MVSDRTAADIFHCCGMAVAATDPHNGGHVFIMAAGGRGTVGLERPGSGVACPAVSSIVAPDRCGDIAIAIHIRVAQGGRTRGITAARSMLGNICRIADSRDN